MANTKGGLISHPPTKDWKMKIMKLTELKITPKELKEHLNQMKSNKQDSGGGFTKVSGKCCVNVIICRDGKDYFYNVSADYRGSEIFDRQWQYRESYEKELCKALNKALSDYKKGKE